MSGRDAHRQLACCNRLTRAFELLGKRWTGLIIDLLLQRPARFSELARAVPGLSERVMSERLRELVDAGIVERRVDPGPPVSTTYALTPLGRRLRPALEELRVWGRELPARDEAVAVRVRARTSQSSRSLAP